jgi:predicted kinase
MNKVYILSGIPGSGKSTYAANSPGYAVSADDYFTKGGEYVFDHKKLKEAHAECFRNFIQQIEEYPGIVIVDNTNTTVEEISPYVLGASAFGYEHEIITFLCDPKVAAERNKHNVPLKSIERMASRLAHRKLPAHWNVGQEIYT